MNRLTIFGNGRWRAELPRCPKRCWGAWSLVRLPGRYRLHRANIYTGDTILNRGTLLLDFSNSAETTNLINPQHGQLQVGARRRIANRTRQAGGAANAQQFNGVDLAAGHSAITLTLNGATGLTLDLERDQSFVEA